MMDFGATHQFAFGLQGLPDGADTSQFAKHVEPGCPYREDDVYSPEKAIATGTTIMAVKFNGGVVMAADTRTSMGDYVANRASRKISQVFDNVFVCRCGSAADTQALTGFVQNYIGQHSIELGKLPAVKTAANLFKIMAYNNKDRLMAGFIVAGYDEKNGGQIFSIPLGGTLLPVDCVCDGSGSGYISGYIDANYRSDMTETEAIDFAQTAVSLAIDRDGSSGGMIRTKIISKEGVKEGVILGNQRPTQK